MEQPSVEYAVGVRPAAPRRVVRGRDPGGRRPPPQGPQDGAVRLQPPLPGALHRPPRQAPDSHPQRCPLRGHALPAGLHVSR